MKILKSCSSAFREFLEARSGGHVFVAFAAVLVFARVLALSGINSRVGGYFWIATYFVLLALTLPALLGTFRSAPFERAPAASALGIAGLLAIVAAMLWPRGLLDMETMSEMHSILGVHRYQRNFGFAAGCHIAYPCESMALTPFLTGIFGPSLAVIRATFLIPFLTGWLFFVTGLIRRCRAAGDDSMAALVLVTMATIYFLPTWLHMPEQSLLPLAYAMTATGLVLHYLETREWLYATGLLLTGICACAVYTPTLALVPLLIAIAWLAWFRGWLDLSTRQSLPYFTGLVVIAFALAIIFRRDIFRPIPPLPENLLAGRAWDVLATVTAVERRMGTHFARFAIVVAMASGLLGFAKNWVGRIVASWAAVVVVAAVWLPGYSWMGAREHLHRATVTLPALLVLLPEVWRRFSLRKVWVPRAAIAMAILFAVPDYRTYLHNWVSPGEAFGGWLEDRIREVQPRSVLLLDLDPALWAPLVIGRLHYTFPRVMTYGDREKLSPPELDKMPTPSLVIMPEAAGTDFQLTRRKADSTEQVVIGGIRLWVMRWNP